jgi:parallel beta-helix repeat protein
MNLHQHRSVFNYFVCIMIVILLLAPSGVSFAQTLPELWVCETGDCGHPGSSFNTIQEAIDAATPGVTINVYPGTYSETASGRLLYDGTGPYQFGLFVGQAKGGITIQGVDAGGAPITNYANVLATVNTNATNNFGPSGFFIEGDNVTIAGIRVGTNTGGQNKTLEVIGDTFTLKNSDIADLDGSLYINDFRFDDLTNISHVKGYRIEGNNFQNGITLDIASGAGVSGPVSGRVITNNKFTTDTDWTSISFSGADTGIPWFTYSVGGAVIQGNTFVNTAPAGQMIRARGTYDNSQFDWASYWNGNTFNKAAITWASPTDVRTYSYPNSYGTFNNVRRIGATIQGEIANAAPGDTVLVGAGTYVLPSVLNLNKANVTLQGVGNPLIQVSGIGERFNISAAGVKIDGFKIEKTDKVGEQNIIYIGASNTSITNNKIFGHFVFGEGDVSRAMVFTGGLSGLNISGNEIYDLRQPAYISGVSTGTISNNYVYRTKGWVIEGGNLDFTGNTWGSGADANVYDIAILATVNPIHHTDIVAMSNANNGAVIEDQRVTPRVLSVVYVDAATAFTTDLGGRYHPYSTIAPALTRVVAGGTVHLAAGTYAETLSLVDKDNVIIDGAGIGATTIDASASTGYGWDLRSDGVLLSDFTFIGPTAGTYGIKVSGNSPVPAAGFTIQNVTIQNSKKTGLDINGVNGVTISNVTVTNTVSGAGIGLTDVNNATLNNITTSGNAWGSIAVMTYGRYFPGGSANVTLTNITNTEAVYTEVANFTTPASPYPVTNFTASEFVYKTINLTDRPNHVFYTKTEAQATALALAFPAKAQSFVLNKTTGHYVVVPGMTIQAAVNAASAGNTIDVAAGTYIEDLTINKALTLLGPNSAVNPNTGLRVAEAVILPAVSAPNPAVCEVMAYLSVSNITIKGFTFDGDNPSLTSGIMIGTADVDACEIMAGYEGMGNITIENNILKNSTYSGVDFYNYYNTAATAGNYIRYNLFKDIGETTYNWGMGVLIYNNFYADITDNVFTGVRTGIQTGNYSLANPGSTGSISNNQIGVWRLGIFHNLAYSAASPFTIGNNTITAENYPGANKWNGILLGSIGSAVNATVSGNNIVIPGTVSYSAPNYTAGYNIWNDTTTAPLTISGGTVTGGDYGIFVNNFEGYTSNADNTAIKIDGVTVLNSGIAGVYVKDSPSNTNNATVYANVQNSTIDTNAIGILVEGADATALASYNKLSGNPIAGITNTSGGILMNGSHNWWGDASGPGVVGPGTGDKVSTNVTFSPWCTNAACTTFATLPVHNVTQGLYYATIQAAIDAATVGDTINVAAGTYDEDVNVNKSVSLIGAGASSTTLRGIIGGDGATVRVNASNVTIAGFTITRLGNNLTDWNNAGLNSAGIAIQGTAITAANIHDNTIFGNRTGIDINNSSGHTLHNNVITDNRTGLVFRNQTDNLTITDNDITNNWTVGVLFLDASGGINIPVQTALNSTFSNNNISGNWYGQAVDRQSGGSLPLPGTTNLKNFSSNWWGTANPVISTANSTEPGYAIQIPVAYGGTAVAPGGQPDILGSASANIVFNPFCADAACATFTEKEYTLTVVSAHGVVTKSPAQATYHNGDVVTLGMTAVDAGWTFTGWTPALAGDTVTINGNTTVTANFTQNEYILTVLKVGNGTVTPNIAAPYHLSDVVVLTAVADAGWIFTGWTGACTGPGTCSVTMDAAKSVTANFMQPPTVVSINRTYASPTSASTLFYTVTFSQAVTGVYKPSFTLTTTGTISGASVSSVSGSGTTYTVLVNSGTGYGTIRLNLIDTDVIKNALNIPLGGTGAGNGDFTTGQEYTKLLPTVLSINRTYGNPTSLSTLFYTVKFSEAVTGVYKPSFMLTTTGTISGASVSSVSGSGATYTVLVNSGTGDGTIRLDLIDTDAIKNAGNTPLGGPGAGNGDFTTGQAYTVIKTLTTVVSINRTYASPTAASNLFYTVTFSDAVTGVYKPSFALTTTGTISGAYVSSVSGSGATYTVLVYSGTGSGTIRLDLIDTDTIKNAVNTLPLGGTGVGNGNFNTGQAYTINRTPPTVVSINRAYGDPTSASNLFYTVTFSEAVTGVYKPSFALTTTGLIVGASVTSVSGSGTTYTVMVNSGTGSGTIRLDLIDTDVIKNVLYIPLGGAGAGNGSFNTGQTYTVR